MEESTCELYLKSKNKFPEQDIHLLVSQLLKADPDVDGKNCEFIIDSFLEGHFKLDEDEERVKEDILKFKELFGDRRPLPKKGYRELKVMIREKSEKGTKKTIAKSETKKSKTIFNDCKSFFKNVKQTLPEPYASYTKEQSDALFDEIQQANPTDNFNNCIWIVEELKKGNIQENDLPEVKKYLEKYFQKLKLPLPNFYPNFPVTSNYQLVKDVVDDAVDLLSTSDFGILFIPKTKEASCYYGSQSSWCTARRDRGNMYGYYSSMGPIYIWFDKVLKDKFQFHFEEFQFMDRDDNPISKEQLENFKNHPILKLIFDEKLKLYFIAYAYANFMQKRFPEAEEYIKKDPLYAYLYAKNVVKGEWPEAEPYILKDPEYVYKYAEEVLKGRWMEAEPYLLEKANDIGVIIFRYAKDVVKGRWLEAEPYILNDPNASYEYAKDVLKNRWREAEDIIMKSEKPKLAYYYANKVVKGRWEEAEDVILKDPEIALKYTSDVLKKRWKELEDIIKTNPELAEEYAYKIVKGRWLEAEPYIMKNPQYAYNYAINVLKRRWLEAEPFIFQDRVFGKYYQEAFKI